MVSDTTWTLPPNHVQRRRLLKVTGIAAAMAIAAPVSHRAYAGALTKEQREKLTPDDIIR